MSQEDVLQKVKEQSVYPDELMSEISKSTMSKTLVISTVAHVLLILITSIGFISLCVKYNSLDPRTYQEAEKKAEVEKQKADAAQEAQTAKPAKPATTSAASDGESGNGGDGTSPIEQELEEVDTNYPTGSGVGFDAVDSLEE